MIDTEITLEIDSYYSEYEIISLKMKPLTGHNMNYITYEKESQVYFFEKVDNNLLRLFCSTSRASFYLS